MHLDGKACYRHRLKDIHDAVADDNHEVSLSLNSTLGIHKSHRSEVSKDEKDFCMRLIDAGICSMVVPRFTQKKYLHSETLEIYFV